MQATICIVLFEYLCILPLFIEQSSLRYHRIIELVFALAFATCSILARYEARSKTVCCCYASVHPGRTGGPTGDSGLRHGVRAILPSDQNVTASNAKIEDKSNEHLQHKDAR